ncbi:hypothetical protein MKX03_014680, partial [Papaver bracteatum]
VGVLLLFRSYATYLLLEITEMVKYLKHPGKFAHLGGKLFKPQEMCSLGERHVSYRR